MTSFIEFQSHMVPYEGRITGTISPGFYTVGHTMAGWGFKDATPVSDDLIDIAGTPVDDMMQDVGKFVATGPRYAKAGLTHKRGYLLYGPPGSGKTSLGLMAGRRFVRDFGGIVIYAGDINSFYHGVELVRASLPGVPSMYLMEEVDGFVDNTSALSILDGERSINKAVFVAMTNYKDKLPPRIANRPGRFDRVMWIDAPPYTVQLEYLRRLEARLEEGTDKAKAIADSMIGLPVQMSHLREAFVSHVLMDVPVDYIRTRFDQMFDVAKAAEAGVDPGVFEEIESEDEDPDDDDDDDDEDDCNRCGYPKSKCGCDNECAECCQQLENCTCNHGVKTDEKAA